jgi:arylsulfatase A-like enzyme
MAAIDRLGLAERTVIVFFSDNGGNMYNVVDGAPPTSNSPLRGGKAILGRVAWRVPCVIAWPGLTNPAAATQPRSKARISIRPSPNC